MSETALIEDCINNSSVAQRELYNRFSGVLFGICYRYASCRQDAEDMLQEGFIKILIVSLSPSFSDKDRLSFL